MISCALPLAQFQTQRDAILAAVTRVFDGGAYILGEEVGRWFPALSSFMEMRTLPN